MRPPTAATAVARHVVTGDHVFSSRRRHTSSGGDWSSDVCSSDLLEREEAFEAGDSVWWGWEDAVAKLGRSEERRVGKEGRSRWAPYHLKKSTSHHWFLFFGTLCCICLRGLMRLILCV